MYIYQIMILHCSVTNGNVWRFGISWQRQLADLLCISEHGNFWKSRKNWSNFIWFILWILLTNIWIVYLHIHYVQHWNIYFRRYGTHTLRVIGNWSIKKGHKVFCLQILALGDFLLCCYVPFYLIFIVSWIVKCFSLSTSFCCDF